jgi:hypothetical protein
LSVFFAMAQIGGMSSSGTGSSSFPGSSSLNITISEKLTRENFLLWQTQVLPEIYGAQLYGYLDGSIEAPEKETTVKDKDGVEITITNPNYSRWTVQDQSVLGFLVRNMGSEVLTQMVGLRTSRAVWKVVMEMFASQYQAWVVQFRTRLNQCRKEDKIGQAYLGEIKDLSDEMAAAGKPLDNLDVISHILSGLDEEYDGFVAAITTLIKAEKNVSLSDVYSQFMSYEAQMKSRKSSDGSSVNMVTHGGRGGGRGHGDHQKQYCDCRYEYDRTMAMAMAAMIVRIMVVAVADMVVVVAKATENSREIVRTMVAAPMTLAKSVARSVTLH